MVMSVARLMHNHHPSQLATFHAPHRWTGSQAPYLAQYQLFYEPYFLGLADMPRYHTTSGYGACTPVNNNPQQQPVGQVHCC